MEQVLVRENVTDRTEQQGSPPSAHKRDGSLVPGEENVLVFTYQDKYKICDSKCSFQVYPESRHAAG